MDEIVDVVDVVDRGGGNAAAIGEVNVVRVWGSIWGCEYDHMHI